MVPDLKDRIRQIVQGVHLASLATIAPDGKPWVRYVMLAGSEDLSLRCATFLSARKVDHIRKNPEVHITCGVTDPRKVDAYLQIAGHGDVVNERVQKMAFWNETLETVFKGPDDPDYGLVVVRPHRIELWKPGGRTPEVWES